MARFDLQSVLLPRWLTLFEDLIARRVPGGVEGASVKSPAHGRTDAIPWDS
jgi:hypothetical protein